MSATGDERVERVQPRLTVLTPEQIERVHAYSLQILARTGVRVDSPRALALLARAQGTRVDGTRVTFDPALVEWAIQAAPPAIDVYDRAGRPVLRLGDGVTRFGAGVTNLFYQDPASGALLPFAREHMAAGTRLAGALPAYDIVSTLGILRDLPESAADLYGVLEMAANTVKPLVLLISDEKQFVPALDLLERLGGDLAGKPFAIPYLNPVTPLIVNRETGDKLLDAVARGMPLIYSNYGMAGTTTPITPAGTLALLNAELLAGLVLAQLAREGAPVVLGSLPAFFDMKGMQDFYDVQTVTLSAACAEMMAHYRIPHAGTSGSSIGAGADLPAAGMHWLNHVIACLGKTGLAPFVGGTLGSKAFSPEVLTFAADVIGQARRLAAGFALDDASVAAGELAAAGPGGSFLAAKSTRKHFRDAYYTSPIFARTSLEKWEESGRPQAAAALREYTLRLLAEAPPPGDHDELIARGEEFIRQRRSAR